MSWKTVANALDRMPENTYRLHFRLLYSKLKTIPSYVDFMSKEKKRTEELRKNTYATITFLGGERRWLIDGGLAPFRGFTHFLCYKQIAGQEDADLDGKPEMYFVIAQRFDKEKLHYLSIDIIFKKPNKKGGALKEEELIHLADFPIPSDGVLDCFWDDENYNRINQPPFNWVDTRNEDWGVMDTFNNIYGEPVHVSPRITFENNGVEVEIDSIEANDIY